MTPAPGTASLPRRHGSLLGTCPTPLEHIRQIWWNVHPSKGSSTEGIHWVIPHIAHGISAPEHSVEELWEGMFIEVNIQVSPC